MFSIWFKVLFYFVFYVVGIPAIVWVIIDTAKKTKYTLENPIEYEEDFVE